MTVLETQELKNITDRGHPGQGSGRVDLGWKRGVRGHRGDLRERESTLLHMLGGLDRPTGGLCAGGGKDIFSLKDEELTIFRRRKIGFVFQSFNLVPVLSAYENIILPIQLDGARWTRTMWAGSSRPWGWSSG